MAVLLSITSRAVNAGCSDSTPKLSQMLMVQLWSAMVQASPGPRTEGWCSTGDVCETQHRISCFPLLENISVRLSEKQQSLHASFPCTGIAAVTGHVYGSVSHRADELLQGFLGKIKSKPSPVECGGNELTLRVSSNTNYSVSMNFLMLSGRTARELQSWLQLSISQASPSDRHLQAPRTCQLGTFVFPNNLFH